MAIITITSDYHFPSMMPFDIKFKTRKRRNVKQPVRHIQIAKRYMEQYMKGKIELNKQSLKILFDYLEYDNFTMIKVTELHNRNWK